MKITYKDIEPYLNEEDKDEYLKSLLIQREEKRMQDDRDFHAGMAFILGFLLLMGIIYLLTGGFV